VRFVADPSLERHGEVVIGGSPLTVLRLTASGGRALDRAISGDDVGLGPFVRRLLDVGIVHPLPVGPGSIGPDQVTVVVPVLGVAPDGLPAGSIVVDDGSDPPVADSTVRLSATLGPGAARNRGLELVATPIVAFVDADVTLPGGWLDHLLPHFDDPEVGAVAPRVVSPPTPGRRARYEARRSPLDLGPVPARVRVGTRVGYVPAAALVCRAEAVRAIGGFDPALRYGEDVDLVWRLDQAGWRVRYEPAAVVHHPPRPTWRAWVRQRVAYGSSAAPLARRHTGALTPVRINGWTATVWALLVAGHPVVAVVLALGSAAALVPKLPLPAPVSMRLAVGGTVRAGEPLASAVRRVWWPILAVAALRWRPARVALAASAVAALDPLRVVDDVAYSIGVWRGVVRERHLGAVLPAVRAWPGGRAARATVGAR
jgi:mycofactocin system glycosyltransferase